MERKTIDIQGITRAFPDNISLDGATHELINLRKYKKGLRPIGAKSLYSSVVDEDSATYLHTTSDGNVNLITKTAMGLINHHSDPTSSSSTTLTAIAAVKEVSFASLKNVLIIINETDEELHYLLYDVDTGAYQNIGTNRFPDALNINVITSGGYTYPEDSQYFETDDVSGDSNRESYAMGLARDIETQVNKDGYYTGYAVFRYAYEMYDGTIIKHSAPVVLKRGIWKWYADEDFGYDRVFVYVGVDNLSYQVLTSNSDISSIKSTYGDLIKSVNIYMSRPIVSYDPDWTNITSNSDGATFGNVANAVEMNEKNTNDIYQELADASYRLVQRINLDDVEYDDTGKDLKVGDVNDLETKKALDVDNYSHHELFGASIYNYNSRLFLGNTKTTLFDGFNPANFIQKKDTVLYTVSSEFLIRFEVEIKTLEGVKTVRSSSYSFTEWKADETIYLLLKTFFAYPDDRATKLRVMITTTTVPTGSSLSDSTTYKAAEYNLTASTTGNFAYYIYQDSDAIDEDDFHTDVQALATVSASYKDRSRIQASKVDNPFYFPAENSYNAGSSKVIAMGANTIPVDSGQFGDYPLFAFCDDGIWALRFSLSGEFLIDSIVPISGHACNTKDSVLSTEFGVVFSTEEGIFLIAGSRPEKISYILEGSYQSALSDNLAIDDLKSLAEVGDVSDYICSQSFLDYISGAKFGYDYTLKELTISDSSSSHSWHYNFYEKSWYKSSLVFNNFLWNYPKMYGETGGSLYDLTEEDWTNAVPCYLETKPIKLELDGFKKLDRSVLRGLIETDDSKRVVLYVLGSIDGLNWNQLTAHKYESGKHYDILLHRAYYSTVQFVFVFSGTLKEDSVVTHLDVSYRNKFGSKLR